MSDKALEVIMFHYVSNFTHHPQVLYRSIAVVTYCFDEFRTQGPVVIIFHMFPIFLANLIFCIDQRLILSSLLGISIGLITMHKRPTE